MEGLVLDAAVRDWVSSVGQQAGTPAGALMTFRLR
jgi:hypothetical protein